MSEWPSPTKVIGTRVPRVDGPAKVTGQARYSSDIQLPGLLIGMILRSPWPAARIQRINLDKARKMPGIKAVVAVQEGPRIVRFYGEELAAVAGVSREACEEALRAIEVEAEPLPFVVREEDAKKADAPRVWEQAPNMPPPRVHEEGNVDAALAECDVVIEGFYTTSVQLHHPMETHGGTVKWDDEGVTAWISTQGIFSVRDGLAGALRLDQNKVRAITEYMGGGFGSKFGPGVEGVLAARLAREAGAPVRLMLSRFEEALAVGNRPSSFQRIKLGAKADGTLHVFDYENYGTAGVGAGQATEGGGGGADLPMPYIYRVPHRRIKQTTVAINAGSSRAFRAPGHPVASFGMESAMDDLAVKLGMDPLELRIKNDPSEIRQREYRIGAERFGWKEKYRKPGSSPGPVKVGVGVASATWGGGGSRQTRGEIQINPDGTVELRMGFQDIGTGTRTVAALTAAEILGLSPDQISVRIGDTLYPPGPGSGGSVTSASVAPTVYDVCTRALEELQKQTGLPDVRGENWKAACKKLGVTPLVVQGRWREGLSSSGVGGVQFAEVAVDTETGLVTVRKIVVVQDCGLIVDPLTAESQVNGGVIMGIGEALYEERVMDWQSGVVLNANFETYKLPGLADVPEIDIVLINMPERGVIGLGEPVHIPTAAAIANAVANALGVRVNSLPITPRKVLAALGKVPTAKA
ncbi:xanthine dehydrogenase family protein molybdopterin-binding subunit [Limisphaera ngatamarikiensis]|uniref:Xanthine dehydrogenase family protein molybdopterin-binding subunit n=1 Tax=Limisphaera ngatamarikiensis TaxID=1324935 RepID=A0A6M1RMA6_9BACT|nr:xanthine dehydrogenase family protein molybdopterin-binding subunit [Limisphaera ngatamarikiensis]NGO38803.1 xanthine dehydrogenase family protein molybdopterin-binding subunit [Limisphaera ngatamarikiensis]